MNINILLGIISFVVWSAFSSWYYITYVKDLAGKEATATDVVTDKEAPTEDKKVEPAKPKKASLPAIDVKKQFFFELDASVLPNESFVISYFDSLKSVLESRSINARIVGHTCDLGSENYNTRLGEKRANHAAGYLRDRFTISDLSIQSKGESAPMVPNNSEKNRSKNRRVTIFITTDEQ